MLETLVAYLPFSTLRKSNSVVKIFIGRLLGKGMALRMYLPEL